MIVATCDMVLSLGTKHMLNKEEKEAKGNVFFRRFIHRDSKIMAPIHCIKPNFRRKAKNLGHMKTTPRLKQYP